MVFNRGKAVTLLAMGLTVIALSGCEWFEPDAERIKAEYADADSRVMAKRLPDFSASAYAKHGSRQLAQRKVLKGANLELLAVDSVTVDLVARPHWLNTRYLARTAKGAYVLLDNHIKLDPWYSSACKGAARCGGSLQLVEVVSEEDARRRFVASPGYDEKRYIELFGDSPPAQDVEL